MKKKVIAILTIIAVISSIFCISAFAYHTLPQGTEIVFNNTVNFGSYNPATTIQLPFTCNNTRYNYMKWQQYEVGVPRLTYNPTNTTTGQLEVYRSGWKGDYKTIIVAENFEISDSDYILLSNNGTINIPAPPPVYEGALENTNAMFGTTLSVMTVIITWLLANQIALCGLYLYILIACIGIGKRFVKT